MAESATYISDFNLTNVSATSDATDGGPQIAMIKTVLKANTFPNIGGQVSSSHTELNILDGATLLPLRQN